MSNHLGDTNKMVGEDHIRDATKMVSDTPRVDSATKAAIEHGTGDVWFVAMKLERELNAANQRIKRLEEAGDTMMSEPCEYTFEQWLKAKEAKP